MPTKKPLFFDGKPVFKDGKPAFSDDPCNCCGSSQNYNFCNCVCGAIFAHLTGATVNVSGIASGTCTTGNGCTVTTYTGAPNGSYNFTFPQGFAVGRIDFAAPNTCGGILVQRRVGKQIGFDFDNFVPICDSSFSEIYIYAAEIGFFSCTDHGDQASIGATFLVYFNVCTDGVFQTLQGPTRYALGSLFATVCSGVGKPTLRGEFSQNLICTINPGPPAIITAALEFDGLPICPGSNP